MDSIRIKSKPVLSKIVLNLSSCQFFPNSNGEDSNNVIYFTGTNVTLPKSVDWRQHGAVTGAKDQGICGSCWSFASTGALEGQFFIKTGKLISLSEQNMIDCSSNNGCHGGQLSSAFHYVSEHGISTETDYPYTAHRGYCLRDEKSSDLPAVSGFVNIPPGDEHKLQEAIATIGPIAAAIDASHFSFHNYDSGIYYDDSCSNHFYNHAVLIVGYGTDEHERDYYIVKNSWGKSWGENGFFRISRNHRNHCALAIRASFPIVH